MNKNNGLGVTIKALRKMRGMTQAEVANLCGLNRSSITNIETGNQTLTVQTINAIAEALGYRVKVKFERIRQVSNPVAVELDISKQ